MDRIVPFAAVLAACAPPTEFDLTLVDHHTSERLGGALVVLERGGLGRPFPDKTRANPNLQGSAEAGPNGVVHLSVREQDSVGVHILASGHRCGQLTATDDTLDLLVPIEATGDAPPTVTGAAFEPPTATPGAQVTVGADVSAADGMSDPLSDLVVLLQPATGLGMALDPPPPGGTAGAWPDGRWTRSFLAPKKSGAHTFFLVAASGRCVVSERVAVTLQVQ